MDYSPGMGLKKIANMDEGREFIKRNQQEH